jgi:hypothetical protein
LAHEGLKFRNYRIVSSFEEKERSGILCFNHPSLPARQIWQRLYDAGVDLAIRGSALRMSPRFTTMKMKSMPCWQRCLEQESPGCLNLKRMREPDRRDQGRLSACKIQRIITSE